MKERVTLLVLFSLLCFGCHREKKGTELNNLVRWHEVTVEDHFSPEEYLDREFGDTYETKLDLLEPNIPEKKYKPLEEGVRGFVRERYDWLMQSLESRGADVPLDTLANRLAQQRRQEFFEDYNDSKMGTLAFILTNQLSAKDSIAYNQDGLLSMILFYTSYTGGAHGMYGNQAKSYDLELQQTITPEVLLDLSRSEEILGLIRDKILAMDKQQDTDSDYPLYGDLVNLDEVTITDNLYLSNEGVTLIYNVYEIGPYAMGEVFVTLSYDELRPYLLAPYDQLTSDHAVLP